MKIGVCINHEADKNIYDSFRKARENGFDNCQLISWDNTLWTDQEAETIQKAQKEFGITITAFWCGWSGPKQWDFYEGQETLGLVPVAFRNQRMQDLFNGSDFAKKLGVTDIVTHAGYLPENPHDPNYAGLLYALRAVALHCKENGQNFLFETGQETPVTLLRMIEDMDTGNTFINLDPANLIAYGKANPVDALDVIGKYIRGVHAKDAVYPTSGRILGGEVPLGEGKVNFDAFIPKLHKLGYDGYLTIEREIDEGEEQTRDILKGKALLENIIAGLEN